MKFLLTTHANVVSIVLFLCEPLCKFMCIYILVMLLVRQSAFCEIQLLLTAVCLAGMHAGRPRAICVGSGAGVAVLYSILLCVNHRPDHDTEMSLHSMSSLD